MNPTLAGFLTFVANQGVPATALPSGSPYPQWAYDVAVEIVNQVLQVVAPTLYMLAVYNLAMSNLLEFAQDPPGSPVYKNNLPYFEYQRQQFNIYGNLLGVVTTTSDEGTSVSVEVPDFVKNLSVADLQYLKTPFGQIYVELAQRVGTSWGLD